MKGPRIAKAASLEKVNRYLEQEYLPLGTRASRWWRRTPRMHHRPLSGGDDLAAILSHVEERVVTPDYTIRYQGKIYQIARVDARAGLRGGRVRVERRLDGSLAVKFREHYVNITECQPRPKTPSSPKPAATSKRVPAKAGRAWMKDFDLQKSPPLWRGMG